MPEQAILTQVGDPFDEAFEIGGIDGEEYGGEGLGKLGLHVARILIEARFSEIDMLETRRGDGPIAGTG